MKTRIPVAAIVAAALAGCASTPMDRSALRQHIQRNCGVQATVSPAYAIDSTGTGIGTRNVAYAVCLRSAELRA
ncbi:hypothetical protein [Rhodanobacter sp. DHG33]|uniref:hypothetical protein n=1 Tax=Rhodanobacter sp. DHG33 TaxID=2775921 RepID=UPI00177E4559|nr:hypothetical protein [Rhodanobacter sp. DHG33]MBD8898609.1 hypothetical protein [Rhodanobacter sp. DHG33]